MNNEFNILSNIIKNRRSIYPASYIQKEIPKNLIEQILANANDAPTHKLTQPWRFTVMRNEAKTKLGVELQKIYKAIIPSEKFLQKKYDSFATKTAQAECIIAINIQFSGKIAEWEEVAATACAVQNMALTAEALQIGAYWSTPPLITGLGDFLGLAENEKCYGLFYMGYHEEEPRAANRTPIAEKVKWMEGE